MEDSTPQRIKRRRHSISDDEQPVTRSEKHWYEDGNVVLQAESTEFRVHRGVLSRHSTRFKTLLTPVSEGGEGLSRVEIASTAKEVDHLLTALYDSPLQMKIAREQDGPRLEIILALVRLGHKYGFEELRNEAVGCLEDEFPSDLGEWLESDRDGFNYISIEDEEKWREALCQLLVVAVECNIRRVQTSIYLDIWSRFELEEIVPTLNRVGEDNVLPTELKLACLHGQMMQRAQAHKKTYQWLSELPYKGCTAERNRCKKQAKVLFASIFEPTFFVGGLEDWDNEWSKDICTNCASRSKITHEDGRKKLWDILPSFVGLGKWEELTNF